MTALYEFDVRVFDERWFRMQARQMRRSVNTLDLAALYTARADAIEQGIPELELVGMIPPRLSKLRMLERYGSVAEYWAVRGGDLPEPGVR